MAQRNHCTTRAITSRNRETNGTHLGRNAIWAGAGTVRERLGYLGT
jgi:hypothetical protein